MSWLSLRIPPAKKAWKSFTSKLQTRLHKLPKSKVIKKPKSRVFHVANTASSAKLAAILINPSPFLDQRPKKIPQPSNKGLRFRQSRRYFFKKKAAGPRPVYIDKVFKEPAATELVASRGKITKVSDQEAGAPGTGSSVNVKATAIGTVSTSAADDMWESLALASPQMNGIDQRAEDFIQSFRAEMEIQEIRARRL